MSEPTAKLEQALPARNYIERLRSDPRVRAMFDSWVYQATTEAELKYPDRRDDRERASFSAIRAVELAMSFVLDNDGELKAVEAERDMLRKHVFDLHSMAPLQVVMPTMKDEVK